MLFILIQYIYTFILYIYIYIYVYIINWVYPSAPWFQLRRPMRAMCNVCVVGHGFPQGKHLEMVDFSGNYASICLKDPEKPLFFPEHDMYVYIQCEAPQL